MISKRHGKIAKYKAGSAYLRQGFGTYNILHVLGKPYQPTCLATWVLR